MSSPLTPHYTPLTPHCTPLAHPSLHAHPLLHSTPLTWDTPHCTPLTPHCTTHPSPLTAHPSPLTAHLSPLTAHLLWTARHILVDRLTFGVKCILCLSRCWYGCALWDRWALSGEVHKTAQHIELHTTGLGTEYTVCKVFRFDWYTQRKGIGVEKGVDIDDVCSHQHGYKFILYTMIVHSMS